MPLLHQSSIMWCVSTLVRSCQLPLLSRILFVQSTVKFGWYCPVNDFPWLQRLCICPFEENRSYCDHAKVCHVVRSCLLAHAQGPQDCVCTGITDGFWEYPLKNWDRPCKSLPCSEELCTCTCTQKAHKTVVYRHHGWFLGVPLEALGLRCWCSHGARSRWHCDDHGWKPVHCVSQVRNT